MLFRFNLSGRNIYNYEQYRNMLSHLLAQGKTTGEDQSESMIEYAKLNNARMHRWDKTTRIKPALSTLLEGTQKQTWLVLSEGWCGDAAQNLPIIHKMSELNQGIDLQIILRDENLDIMDAYLTNGGRSIPKLIAINESNEVIFTWGPRPKKMNDKVMELKATGEDYAEELHKMYATDRSESLQDEFITLLLKS